MLQSLIELSKRNVYTLILLIVAKFIWRSRTVFFFKMFFIETRYLLN